MSDMDWIKKRLMGSSTMPVGTGQGGKGPLNVLQSGHVHDHVHSDDGSCCGGYHDHEHHAHDHSHDHSHNHHDHDHVHGSGCCDHDDEEDVTNPSGGCC